MKIGNGEILNMDCRTALAAMGDDSVDCIATDPAYRVISGGTNSPEAYGWRKSVLAANDGKIFAHNNISFAEYLPDLFRVLRPGGHFYCMVNALNLRDLLNVADAAGFGFHNLLRWDKDNRTANRWYMKDSELTCFFYKRPARRINYPGSKQGFFAPNPKSPKLHPTEKPVALFRHYIENSTEPGDLVLDPFCGSGTTAVAAEQAGRRWVTMESDPDHYWPAVARLIDAAVKPK